MSRLDDAVKWAVRIAMDESHGYDQAKRNNPDYDCSSLISTALNNAGFNVSTSSTTHNLYPRLIDCGFKTINIEANRKRGDIFLKVGKHVVLCTDENKIVHASINEKGTTVGGKTGDQTGKEICVRSFYNYKDGWDYHLRFEEKKEVNEINNKEIIKIGQSHVNDFVNIKLEIDGINGVKTRKASIMVIQHAINLDYNTKLAVDGVWGSKSNQALGRHYVKHGEVQYMVTALEILLMLNGYNPNGVESPGKFGAGLEKALNQFQRENGFKIENIARYYVFKKLINIK